MPAEVRRTGDLTCQVFVSFKDLDLAGNPTEDSKLARMVFQHLQEKGLRVFYSPETLERLGTSAYKRAIDDALDECEVLVAVGTSREHLESAWVRYEWDGFSQDILSGLKPAGRIFTYVQGIPSQRLPRVLRQGQVFWHERGDLDRLCNFIRHSLGKTAECEPCHAGDSQ